MDSEQGHVEHLEKAASAPRSYSLVTSIVVGLVMIGAGIGVGIGIGAGIWKNSSSTPAAPDDWFFSQRADGARVVKATNGSDAVFVTLEGADNNAAYSGMDSTFQHAGMLPREVVVSILNADPGKNAMLVCNDGENKLATPMTLNYGEANGDEVSYSASLVPFNNATWSRLDEGRVLNASSTISSFTAGEEVQFNSSCFLFIDGFWGDLVDNVKEHPLSTIEGVFLPVAAVEKGTRYAIASIQGDEDKKKEIEKEAEAALTGSVAEAGALLVGGAVATGVGEIGGALGLGGTGVVGTVGIGEGVAIGDTAAVIGEETITGAIRIPNVGAWVTNVETGNPNFVGQIISSIA